MKRNAFLLAPVCGRIGWCLLALAVAFLCLSWAEVIPSIGGGWAQGSLGPEEAVPSVLAERDAGPWFFGFQNNLEWNDEIYSVALVVALLLISRARLKDEDELTGRLRLNAFLWGLEATTALYVAAMLAEHVLEAGQWVSLFFFTVFFVNLFLPILMLAYVLKFRYDVWRLRRSGSGASAYEPRPVRLVSSRWRGLWLAMTVASGAYILLVESGQVEFPAWADRWVNGAALYAVPLVGLMLLIISRVPTEDEYTACLRLRSAMLALHVMSIAFVVAQLTVFGIHYLALYYVFLYGVQVLVLIFFYASLHSVQPKASETNEE